MKNAKKLKNKRKIWIFLSICLILVICITSVIIVNLNKKNTLNTNAKVGVWWWNKENSDKYLEFAASNGVDEIYYCDTGFTEETREFIMQANNKNIDVYLLCGEKEWIEDKAPFYNILLRYREFQSKNKDIKFKGVHLDVEPHQFSDFNSSEQKRKEYLDKFVNFVKTIVEENSDISFDFDIPFWFDDIIMFEGVQKPVYKHVIDSAGRVFVMSYRDTAAKIIDVASEELDYAKSLNKEIFISVQMSSDEGDKVSFIEEGKEYLIKELKKLDTMLDQSYGISIHHIKTWYELKR